MSNANSFFLWRCPRPGCDWEGVRYCTLEKCPRCRKPLVRADRVRKAARHEARDWYK